MAFIGRDNQAAVSCADGYLTVWNLETFKLLRYVRLRDVQVGLRFCPAMDVLASWGVDEFNHEVIVWDVDKLKVLRVLDGHSEAVKDIYEVAPPSAATDSDLAETAWDPILGEGPAVDWILNVRGIGHDILGSRLCFSLHSRRLTFAGCRCFFVKPSFSLFSWPCVRILPSPTLPARILYEHSSTQRLYDHSQL